MGVSAKKAGPSCCPIQSFGINTIGYVCSTVSAGVNAIDVSSALANRGKAEGWSVIAYAACAEIAADNNAGVS